MRVSKRRFFSLAKWVFALLLLLVALGAFTDSFLAGLLVLGSSLLLLPPLRDRLGERYGLVDGVAGNVLVLVLLVSGLLLIPGGEDPSPGLDEQGGDVVSAGGFVSGEVTEAANLTGAATREVMEGDYEAGRAKSLEAKERLSSARRHYRQRKASIPEEDAQELEGSIEAVEEWSTATYRTTLLLEYQEQVLREVEATESGEELSALAPKIRMLARGYRENAKDWRALADTLDSTRGAEGSGVEEVARVQAETADMLEKQAGEIEELGGPVPGREGEIPTSRESGEEGGGEADVELVDQELVNHFESFDSDGDGSLSIAEAEEFFYWVENNIRYRYDDENVTEPLVGTLVGDGRPGDDYRQTPLETFREGAGDCEDMATLEQAFYRHFGIQAYVVGLNSDHPVSPDHSATAVLISGDPQSLEEKLGGVLYYEVEEGTRSVYGEPVQPGTYVLVDNSYSAAYGYVTGGFEQGRFRIHCYIPFRRGYDDAWKTTFDACELRSD